MTRYELALAAAERVAARIAEAKRSDPHGWARANTPPLEEK